LEKEEEVAGGGCGANEGARGGGSCGWKASPQTETNRGASREEQRREWRRTKTLTEVRREESTNVYFCGCTVYRQIIEGISAICIQDFVR